MLSDTLRQCRSAPLTLCTNPNAYPFVRLSVCLSLCMSNPVALLALHPRASPFYGILDLAFRHLGPFSEEPAVARPSV